MKTNQEKIKPPGQSNTRKIAVASQRRGGVASYPSELSWYSRNRNFIDKGNKVKENEFLKSPIKNNAPQLYK